MVAKRTPLIATVAGLATAGFLFGAGAAGAHPHGGLVDTTCSFAQVQAATQQHAPDLAANPDRMAKIERALSLSPDERHAKAHEMREKKGDISPEKRAEIREWKDSPEGQAKIASMQNVFNTCDQY